MKSYGNDLPNNGKHSTKIIIGLLAINIILSILSLLY